MSKHIRIHIFIHAAVEGPGYISQWIEENNIHYNETHFYQEDFHLPKHEDYDLLIIMGGSPGVYEEKKYPWLKDEKRFIKKALEQKKYIVGICLGAQLLAEALGGKVYKQNFKEIGWFPIRMAAAAQTTILKIFPKEFTTFHWHGDAFDLPDEMKNLASSEATEYQAFVIDDRVVALQFHPEVTKQSLQKWCDESNELKPDKYVQSQQEILDKSNFAEHNHQLLKRLLDQLYKNWRMQQISHVL